MDPKGKGMVVNDKE
jgi:hypothetical protein